tara:strand:- start:18502 stop:18702 length:201 start_codon:yes stop_codon:yes gene_type:complete
MNNGEYADRLQLAIFLRDIADWVDGTLNGDEGVNIKSYDDFIKAVLDHSSHLRFKVGCVFCAIEDK